MPSIYNNTLIIEGNFENINTLPWDEFNRAKNMLLAATDIGISQWDNKQDYRISNLDKNTCTRRRKS